MLSESPAHFKMDRKVIHGQAENVKKRILDYLQLTLQGTGIASLGTLSIFEPKFETVLYGGMCLLMGLIIAAINRGQQ